jgi:hypothetical protein
VILDPISVLPDAKLSARWKISAKFLELGVASFQGACQLVRHLPYGYNSDRDDPMALFREKMGTCTTKHGASALRKPRILIPQGTGFEGTIRVPCRPPWAFHYCSYT